MEKKKEIECKEEVEYETEDDVPVYNESKFEQSKNYNSREC